MDDDEYNEAENECDACGGDHETQFCEVEFCATCEEVLDNCDCEEPVVVTGDELKKVRP